VHAIFEIGLGAEVLLASKVEGRVGIELKWLVGQAVKGFVHGARK
jgi:hypothetical protein